MLIFVFVALTNSPVLLDICSMRCIQLAKLQLNSQSSMRRSKRALLFILSDGLYHALSCTRPYSVDHLSGINRCPLSRMARTDDFLAYGPRKDTTSTNISGFWSFRVSIQNSSLDSPNIPTAMNVNSEYVLIFLACNDSPEIIKSVMDNKLFHAECRRCMNNPKAMESEPMWIRALIRDLPKLPPTTNVSWIIMFFKLFVFQCHHFFATGRLSNHQWTIRLRSVRREQ